MMLRARYIKNLHLNSSQKSVKTLTSVDYSRSIALEYYCFELCKDKHKLTININTII